MKSRPLPPGLQLAEGGPRFWKSLEEFSESPEFLPYLHREFPERASEWESGMNRKRFLQIMAASFALAGLSSCSRQTPEKLVPYTRRPTGQIPGEPIYYASTFPFRGYGQGILVRTEMGRPTKIEGNPDHPASLGATSSLMQASILGLYDPDRSQTIREGKNISTREGFQQFALGLTQEHEQDQGAGLYIMTGATTSPTLGDQLQRLQKRFPQMSWCPYEPAAPVRPRFGTTGNQIELLYDLSRADIIVSLDCDFLLEGPASLMHTKAFSARRRDPAHGFNRLYVVESTPSITGAKADQRWRKKPSEIAAFAQSLADAILQNAAPSADLAGLVAELQQHRGKCVVMAGDYQPEAVHVLAYEINEALGNIGATVSYRELTPPITEKPLTDFIRELHLGKATTLLIAGSNPVYDLPPDLDFAGALSRVPRTIHLGLYDDETGSRCRWHLPEAHYLESWGDINAIDGTVSFIQPMIEPLYPAASSLLEVMSILVDLPPQKGYEILQGYWSTRIQSWENALKLGVVRGAASPFTELEMAKFNIVQPTSAPEGLEVSFRPDASADDGRYANNGWLQELPRPLTKITWDNVAMISPKTASVLGLSNGDVALLVVENRSMNVPVWIQPGHADACISLTLGYGRTQAGEVANGVGFNASLLRASGQPWMLSGARLSATGKGHAIATTQNHFTMEGRDLVRVETLADFQADPLCLKHENEEPPFEENLYPSFPYKDYAWAMSIDLNTCVGCNACVVACQAENNIPVVGKDQVGKGREMHWIRVDRYFEGSPEEPAMHFQPVTCMQCEDAPCEVVCPVGATVHSSEGLNDMVYNRCVGTRYCSNNCPYKVRRFNFLEYSDTVHPTIAMQKNPDVTVRSRGVMEKCTYCVQRIESARIGAQKEKRPIRDGEIVTACQSACPAEAIVFGDRNNPGNRVSKLKASPRDYGLLEDLNTRPRTTYLAKITNPPA